MSATTRTDIHRPSAPEFDPEAYTLVGVYDLEERPQEGTFGPTDAELFHRAVEALAARGIHSAPHASGCGHCGQTHIRYVALMYRADAVEAGWIIVGQHCLSNRFQDMTADQFKAIMARAAESRAAQKLVEAERAFLADKPELTEALRATVINADLYDAGYELFTISDIARKLRRYGSISEKQAAFVIRLAAQIVTHTAEAADKAAAKAAEPALPPVALGKGLVIEGVCSEPKWTGDEFPTLKMMVTLDDGTKVWGAVPRDIADEVTRGTRVRFTATVEAAPWFENESIGKFLRGRKAEILVAA